MKTKSSSAIIARTNQCRGPRRVRSPRNSQSHSRNPATGPGAHSIVDPELQKTARWNEEKRQDIPTVSEATAPADIDSCGVRIICHSDRKLCLARRPVHMGERHGRIRHARVLRIVFSDSYTQSIPGRLYLELNPEEFVERSPLMTVRRRWQDVESFAVGIDDGWRSWPIVSLGVADGGTTSC